MFATTTQIQGGLNCCWCESNGGFWTPHDACSEQPGDDDDGHGRSLYDQEVIKVEISSPGDSATNTTYRYIDFVLDDVDTAALAKQTTISSSYGFVQRVNYGTNLQELVLTSKTAHFTMNSYLECGFTQAVYELWVGRHYSPEIPVTLRFVRQNGTTLVSLSQIETSGYCASPWDNSVNGVSGTFDTTMTWSTCQNDYTPRMASVNGHTLFRLKAGQATESSKWSQLLFVVDGDAPY
eukprot:Nitzschia sp. Nitz4//scaffold101_size76361//56177//56887//NITZ4_005610-RA/size76361-processed-gene-0.43-mRNA-1//-1//CDS//3329532182//1602//frame0